MDYAFTLENGMENYGELQPIYRKHFAEMAERLKNDGIEVGAYNPRLGEYFKSFNAGYLLNYVVRTLEGTPVGYSNVYLTHDMHTSELVAQEDTIFILREHRNGIGKKLVRFILGDLERRGCKRVRITPVTDLRVGKIWKRMGFEEVATLMQYTFKGN